MSCCFKMFWGCFQRKDRPICHLGPDDVTKKDEFSEEFLSALALTPPPPFLRSFSKNCVAIIFKFHAQKALFKGPKLQHTFLDWKWPSHPLWNFPKICPSLNAFSNEKVISSDWGRLLFNVSTIFGRVDAVLLISRNQVDKSAKVCLEGVEGAEDETEQENAEGGRISY